MLVRQGSVLEYALVVKLLGILASSCLVPAPRAAMRESYRHGRLTSSSHVLLADRRIMGMKTY